MRLTSSSEKQGGGETRAEADQDKWQSGTKADQDQQDQQDQHRPRGRALFPRQTGTRADQVAENRMEVTPPGPVSGQCWGHLRAKSFPPNNKSNE